MQETQQQFVDHAGLAGATGAGDTDNRRLATGELPLFAQARELGLVVAAFLDRGQRVADRNLILDRNGVRVIPSGATVVAIHITREMTPTPFRALDHIFDHRDEAEVHAVVGVIDALDAVGLQFADFLRCDRAAAAAEHADVACAALLQHVDHVLEVLDVAALVAGQRDRIGILLQRRAHDILDRSVVAEMDHLGALRLDQAAHDVDRGVVAVEQAGCSNEAQRHLFAGWLGGGDVLDSRAHGGSGTQ